MNYLQKISPITKSVFSLNKQKFHLEFHLKQIYREYNKEEKKGNIQIGFNEK